MSVDPNGTKVNEDLSDKELDDVVGGSIGSFFKNLGNTIAHTAETVVHNTQQGAPGLFETFKTNSAGLAQTYENAGKSAGNAIQNAFHK